MDPRNFLTESGIYQFMTHRYDSGSQSADTVAAVIQGSFMQSRNPGGGYSSYSTLINAAGKNGGVNPNVLAAMIIQEQGWSGSSLVSGTYPRITIAASLQKNIKKTLKFQNSIAFFLFFGKILTTAFFETN